jgi:hypothetical protein
MKLTRRRPQIAKRFDRWKRWWLVQRWGGSRQVDHKKREGGRLNDDDYDNLMHVNNKWALMCGCMDDNGLIECIAGQINYGQRCPLREKLKWSGLGKILGFNFYQNSIQLYRYLCVLSKLIGCYFCIICFWTTCNGLYAANYPPQKCKRQFYEMFTGWFAAHIFWQMNKTECPRDRFQCTATQTKITKLSPPFFEGILF